MAEDFAENHNVAADHRDRLIAMIGTWYVEAGKYNVMPINGSGLARMIAEKPLVAVPRDSYTYRPGTQSIPFFAAPRVLNRPHSITADVEIPAAGPRECCCPRARPPRILAVHQGRQVPLRPQLRRPGCVRRRIRRRPGARPAHAQVRIEPTGQPDLQHGKGAPGRLQLYIDGPSPGTRSACHQPVRAQPGALTCGANPGSAITDDYPSPFKFTGTIHSVTVDVSGKLIEDTEAELRMHIARQ